MRGMGPIGGRGRATRRYTGRGMVSWLRILFRSDLFSFFFSFEGAVVTHFEVLPWGPKVSLNHILKRLGAGSTQLRVIRNPS